MAQLCLHGLQGRGQRVHKVGSVIAAVCVSNPVLFCRVLQKQFDEEGQGVVVNSIHPGTKHSKILQQSVIPLEVTNNLLHIMII